MAGEFVRANNTALSVTYINARFMEDLLLATQMVQFCTQPDEQGTHRGDAVRWLSMSEWTADSTVLSETDPTDNQVALSGTTGSVGVDATLNPYGGFVKAADFSLAIAPVTQMDKITKRAADAGTRVLDGLAMTQAKATTTVYKCQSDTTTDGFAAGATMATSGVTLRATHIADCQAKLDTLGNTGFDHIGGRYGGVLHPQASAHLMKEPATSAGNITWSDINKHIAGQQEKILKGDAGELFNVKLFSSPLVDSTTQVNSVDVYNNIVIAVDGVGCSQLDGEMHDGQPAARIIVKEPGPNTVSQPFDTYSTVSWRWYGAFKLLDSDRVVKLVSAQVSQS